MSETNGTGVAEHLPVGNAPRGRRGLSPHSRKAVLCWHVGSSVGWLGTGLGVLVLALDGDAPAAYLLSVVLGLPLAVLAGLSGLLLALGTRWGLLRHWWVTLKFVLHKVVLGSWLFVLMPALEDAAAGDGPATGAVAGAAGASVLLVLALVLSTVKPFGRVRDADGRIRVPRV